MIDSIDFKSIDNKVYIGDKEPMNYVNAIMTQFKNLGYQEVEVVARGNLISKACSIVMLSRKLMDFRIEKIELSEIFFQNYESKLVPVTAITIKLNIAK